jgi:hypothetical protein
MLSRLGRDYNDPESASIAYESAEGGLAQLAPIPSLFAEISDTLPYDPHEALLFLYRLAEDISRPIAQDDRVHIEYVPRQVVTEFLPTTNLPEGVKLDGIRYRSSRRDGGVSLVLFADGRNVEGASRNTWPEPDPWLKLVSRGERIIA